MALANPSEPQRVLIVIPNWVGDVVMATPTLRALRSTMPSAHMTALCKAYAAPIITHTPWLDEIETTTGKDGVFAVAKRVRHGAYDTALLLTNSFRSALVVRLANIGRRVGYARDGRGWLLTDKLAPPRERGRLVPVPAIDYYLELLKPLGATSNDRAMQLFTSPEDDERAQRVIDRVGGSPVVMLNPGAATKGGAKNWPADRYAQVADHLIETRGATVLLNGSPPERPLLDAVQASTSHKLVNLLDHDSDLHLLKAIAGRCDLVVTNDTGARHVAVAVGAPTISLFGPTDPAWTMLDAPNETVIRSTAAPEYPITGIEARAVIAAADRLLDSRRAKVVDA